jgi:hypothetical protein
MAFLLGFLGCFKSSTGIAWYYLVLVLLATKRHHKTAGEVDFEGVEP